MPGDFTAGYEQVFRYDRVLAELKPLSINLASTGAGNNHSYYAETSRDGRIVAFVSDATDLATNSIVSTPNAMFWDANATPPSGSVNLVLTKTVSTNAPMAYGAFSYTLAVTNIGTLIASSVTVTDTLPVGLTFISASTTAGTVTNLSGVIAANIGSLGIGAGASISVNVLSTNAVAITNTASASSAETDAAPANNSSSVVVNVTTLTAPVLTLTLTNTSISLLWSLTVPDVFSVENATNLTPPVSWLPLTNQIFTNGSFRGFEMPVNTSESTRFFRLRQN